MRRRSDNRGEMFNAAVSELEIERLLTGAAVGNGSLSDLAVFIEEMRFYESYVPSDQAVERLASEAAGMAMASRATAATRMRVSGPARPRWLALSPRITVAALSILLLAGMTGVATAADGAAPGDPLYGLDRAMERIGIGDGSAGERLEEANQLLVEGQTRRALEHSAEALEGDAAANAALEIAIDRVETVADQGATVIQERVGDLIVFMSENIGKGDGVDGREFGQGMAEIARGIGPASPTGDEAPDPGPAPGNQNQSDNGHPGNGNSNGNGNGNGNTSGTIGKSGTNNEGTGDQGNESGHSDQPGNGDQPGTGGNADPPGNNAGGNGNGPPPDSPSVTAPGRGNRP